MQSNHTRQVAAVAAQLVMRAVLVQESWVDWPDAVYDRVGNIQLSRILDADVRLSGRVRHRDQGKLAARALRGRRGRCKPYAIPAGASDHPLGGLGFARWANEVEHQERDLGVFFDTILVCSVTGSTQAGMLAGFAGSGRLRRVIGIDASAKPEDTRAQVARIARDTAARIEPGREVSEEQIILDER